MKTVAKIFIALFIVSSLISCNSELKETGHGDNHEEQDNHQGHEGHGEEKIVSLNEQQVIALGLKMGTVEMRGLTGRIKINGNLEVPPKSRAGITTFIGGNVKSIRVVHGDKVVKGQVLATLEHPDYITLQERFSEISIKYNFVETEYKIEKELLKNNAISAKQFKKKEAEYKSLKIKYASLKAQLALLNISYKNIENGNITNSINILSPINGFVDEVNIKLGTYIGTKDKMFSITDNSAVHADFQVYEKDVHLIELGQLIDFTVSNRLDKKLTAKLTAIGKEFEDKTRAVHIHAEITDDIKGLIPGMYISGYLQTGTKLTQTLPNDAIVNQGTKSYIFIEDKLETVGKNKEVNNQEGEEEHDEHSKMLSLKMIEITVGITAGNYTEVIFNEALPPGTKIAINSAYYLLADMKKEETEHSH